jgi:hypothetical protein
MGLSSKIGLDGKEMVLGLLTSKFVSEDNGILTLDLFENFFFHFFG